MSDRFNNDLANQWRNIVGFICLFLGLVIIGIFNLSDFGAHLKDKLPSKSSFLVAKVADDNTAEAGGGDLLISPPEFTKPELPELVGGMVDESSFSADNIIVKDQETGAVLFSKNEYEKHPIASITKLMSALVLLEQDLDWSTTTVVVGDDVLDTHMYAGDIYTLEELWQAGLIASSNKAILTLVDYIDWSVPAFVERMNQKAVEIGMTDSEFADPTGLDKNNVSTASDVSILLAEALKYKKISDTLREKEITLYSKKRAKSHHMWTTNWLLLDWVPHNFSDFYGGKTGYITASGYNFTMQVGNDLGHVINVVVLGAETHEARFTEARDVAEWVFENYRWPEDWEKYKKGEVVTSTLEIEN